MKVKDLAVGMDVIFREGRLRYSGTIVGITDDEVTEFYRALMKSDSRRARHVTPAGAIAIRMNDVYFVRPNAILQPGSSEDLGRLIEEEKAAAAKAKALRDERNAQTESRLSPIIDSVNEALGDRFFYLSGGIWGDRMEVRVSKGHSEEKFLQAIHAFIAPTDEEG